ncbi:hypothetical protein BURPS668_A2550 [Burkholderia pseudomallei 668]|nr:hypothetical protein BURPS668_A2550 [Burkholderia pseudomallei 668]
MLTPRARAARRAVRSRGAAPRRGTGRWLPTQPAAAKRRGRP